MYTSTVVLVCLVIYCGSVKAITRCCGPKQWMSSVNQVVGEFNLKETYYGLTEVANTFGYDYMNKKIAAVQTVINETARPRTYQMQQILDFNKMEKWIIKDKNCTKMKLKDDMPTPCIPDSASHISSQMLIGEPVDIWFNEYKSGTNARSTITQKDCILVTSSTLTKQPDFIMTVSLYQNVTAGPVDPKIFEVPSFCKQGMDEVEIGFVPPVIPWM